MPPGICRRCNKRKAQHLCDPCLEAEARDHPLYLRVDLLQGPGYGELLSQGTSLLTVQGAGERVELMDGPGPGKASAHRLGTALRRLGAEDEGKPFAVMHSDADEFHEMMLALRGDEGAQVAQVLADAFSYLATLPRAPDTLRKEWMARVPPGGPLALPPDAPPEEGVPQEEVDNVSEASEGGWEPRAQEWGRRLEQEQTALEQDRESLDDLRGNLESRERVAAEKETFLSQLEVSLRAREGELKDHDTRVRAAEATAEKERSRTSELMRRLEELQVRVSNREASVTQADQSFRNHEASLKEAEAKLEKERTALTDARQNLEATLRSIGEREAKVTAVERNLKEWEGRLRTQENEIYTRAKDAVLKETRTEKEKNANDEQMVNIWRQALAAKEQELEERMKALDEERRRLVAKAMELQRQRGK